MSDREKTIAEINEAVSRFMGAGSETEYDRALSVLSDYAGTWIPFLLSELERAQEENRKLIEGLRMATNVLGTVPMNDARLWGAYNKLCDMIKECGVTWE